MRNRPKIVERVEHVIDEQTEPEHGRKYAAAPGPATEHDLVAEQHTEMQTSWAGPGVPVMTDAMWKGLLLGSLLGGAIGAVLFAPLGFLPIGDIATGWRVFWMALIGALAGGTAGALYYGGRLPELEGEVTDADGRPGVGSTPRDPGTDERGR